MKEILNRIADLVENNPLNVCNIEVTRRHNCLSDLLFAPTEVRLNTSVECAESELKRLLKLYWDRNDSVDTEWHLEVKPRICGVYMLSETQHDTLMAYIDGIKRRINTYK